MKSMILIIGLLLSGTTGTEPVAQDMEAISAAVHAFVKHADHQDVKQMETILHQDFRAVVNRLFGSEEVALMDKPLYLDLLKQGKIGGDSREVQIHSIDLEANNAIVRATFIGKELLFTTFLQLVKDVKGRWTIIGDMPRIEKREG